MSTSWQTITIHRDAPTKPVPGEACNGCGICCTADPCPVARLFLWQWRGACRALIWEDSASRYHCGMLTDPARHSRVIPAACNGLAKRFFAKRIAAGAGCDSVVDVDTQP